MYIFDTPYNFGHRVGSEWTPRIDLYEDEISFYIILELAGIKKEDLKILVEDDRIVKIYGERKNLLKNEKNTNHYSVEIRTGRFARNIVLPQKVDTKRISLEQFNGIFKLILDKKCPKKIKVVAIE